MNLFSKQRLTDIENNLNGYQRGKGWGRRKNNLGDWD